MTETSTCRTCGLVKPLNEFARRTSGGPFNRKYSYTQCRECAAEVARKWRAAHPGYGGTGKQAAVPKEERLKHSAVKFRVVDARTRARKFGVPHTITWEDGLAVFNAQAGRCAISGILLQFDKNTPWTLSLDQIIPGQGYVPGNIQWVAWAVNRAKGDLSNDQLIYMCRSILKV